MILSPGFHAGFDLHCFVRARHHSHKHLSCLWVVLSLQVFIHTIFYVHSQPCGLQPCNEQTEKKREFFQLYRIKGKQQLFLVCKQPSIGFRKHEAQEHICDTMKALIC